jgi:RNA polymerase sigma-70 factor (ECF subfamily)
MSEPAPAESSDLQQLFIAEESRLLHFAMRFCNGDFSAAQDLVQDAFLRLLSQGDAVTQPRPWLFATIRNLALNRRRKLARLDALDPDAALSPADAAALPPDQLEHDEAVLLVRLCMDELPPLDRLLVQLKFDDGLSYAAIAHASGLTSSNVGFRLHTIVKRLTAAFHRAQRDGATRG